jgi:hypothetical protein
MDISSLLRKPKKDGDYKKLQQVHFIALIPLKATLRRNFYAEMCMWCGRWMVERGMICLGRDNGSDLDMCKITNQGVTRVWVLTHKSSDSHCEKM